MTHLNEVYIDKHDHIYTSIPKKFTGLKKTWHDNGYLKAQSSFKNGELHGKHIWYYRSGPTWSMDTYKNGKQKGLSTGWKESGEVLYENIV